jgi:steroid 5-alpha reductase family enzyme
MGVEWMLLLWITLGAMAMMVVLWLIHFPARDAGLVDFGWSLGLGTAAVVCAVFADGDPVRRAIVGVLGGVWGYRLAWHLLVDRVLPPEEDGRYAYLRERLGPRFGAVMFPFFQAQALLVGLLAIPWLIAASSDAPPGLWAWLGVGVWITGIVGESIADAQLARFKKRSDSKGKVCKVGLWRYSRHPNYFFEWLMWVAYALVAVGAPLGWAAWFAPILMLFLVLKVTGIPPTEARSIRSRGDAYRAYQRETSAFFPWFPKKESA